MYKKHKLYKLYELWIDSKKNSDGHKRLMKMSESSFLDFVDNYEGFVDFKQRVDEISKSAIRDEKIDDILDDDFN